MLKWGPLYLVDTSAWILHFSKKDSFDLRTICASDDRVLCPPVYQEFLQGIRDDTVYREFGSSSMPVRWWQAR